MDGDLVVPAIQYGNELRFNDRFRRFDTPEERDEYYDDLVAYAEEENQDDLKQNMKSVSRVNLIIRVDTLNEGES